MQHTENESGMTRMGYLIEIGILARTRYRVETDQGGMRMTLSRYTYRHQVHSTLSSHPTVFHGVIAYYRTLCVCIFERRLRPTPFWLYFYVSLLYLRSLELFSAPQFNAELFFGLFSHQHHCCDCILLASLRVHLNTATWCCKSPYI